MLISSHLKGRFDDSVQLGYGEYADPNPISMHIAMENAIANIESIRFKKEKIATYVKNNYDVKIVNENIMNWIRDLRNKKTQYNKFCALLAIYLTEHFHQSIPAFKVSVEDSVRPFFIQFCFFKVYYFKSGFLCW